MLRRLIFYVGFYLLFDGGFIMMVKSNFMKVCLRCGLFMNGSMYVLNDVKQDVVEVHL